MSADVKELIRRENSALVVWDVQDGLVANIFNRDEFFKGLTQLLSEARQRKVAVFYTKITPLPERFQNKVLARLRRVGFNPGEIASEVAPAPDEVVISKNTASIFVGTNFELMVRNAGLSTLVFTGIATNFGIETSARHAQTLGFLPVIAREAVSSYDRFAHERSLENMKLLFPVLTNREIIETWSR
ncbi:MAG: isochorismatase family cysteine hydrolase [Conexivisphaerales archaeon]